jgi:hypothetical protein
MHEVGGLGSAPEARADERCGGWHVLVCALRVG